MDFGIFRVAFSTLIVALLLASCGGGSSSTANATAGWSSGSKSTTTASTTSTTSATASQVAPGGIYVGYYLEDPSTNPEDPTAGAFVLNLPEGNAAFNGSMFFTYVGCQSSNVGAVAGTKTNLSLSGNWSGSLDGHPNSGPYSGAYDPATGAYSGVYSNAGGKQYIDVPGCIKYYVAPNGTWEMFAIEHNQPATFKITTNGTNISWDAISGASMTLVYVLDYAVAQSGSGNPIKWQTILPAPTVSANVAAAGLTSGKEYIIGVMVMGSSTSRLAFGSKKITAP